jgi:hypothetical protein
VSALGQKQTYAGAKRHVRFTRDRERGFPQKGDVCFTAKADMCGAKADVRFGPKAGIRLIDKPPGTHLRRAAFRKMVSSKALEYRKNAELCEEEAERAPTEYFAEQFQKLAQHWWELVEYAEDKGF